MPASTGAPYWLPLGAPPLPATFDPVEHGSWSQVYAWTPPLPAIPNIYSGELKWMFLIPTGPNRGKVCMLRYELDAGTSSTYVWDSAAPHALSETALNPSLASEKICAGVSYMPDGRVIAAGGAYLGATPTTSNDTYFFDPLPGVSWIPTGNMNDERFYPTQIALNASIDSVGQPIVFGGWDYISGSTVAGWSSWEQFDPTTGTWNTIIPGPNYFGASPHAYCLSNDQVVVFADSDAPPPSAGLPGFRQLPNTISAPGVSWFMSPSTSTVVQGPNTSGATDRLGATSVLLHQLGANGGTDRVLVFGGTEGLAGQNPPGLQIYQSVDELSLTTNSWVLKADMNVPRVESNAVVLPTGEVLVVGGLWEDRGLDALAPPSAPNMHHDWPIGVSEIYDPTRYKSLGSGESRWAAPRQVGVPEPQSPLMPLDFTPRSHHAMALLLPDGSVLCAGGKNQNRAHMNLGEIHAPVSPIPSDTNPARADVTGEVYRPPYLHSDLERPQMTRAPDTVLFTASPAQPSVFSIDVACKEAGSFVDRVVLIRPGAVNHSVNSTQRYIELSHQNVSGSFPGTVKVEVTAPTRNLGPLGYYMLFAVVNHPGKTPSRVPTPGRFIRLL